jgi:hypothetical protein
MAEPIGAIRVDASIGTAKYTADARKIKAETVALERDIKTRFAGMSTAVKGFGGAMAAGLSVGLLAGIAKKALDMAAAIGTTAKQLGVTTKELQTFRYAAQQVGITNVEADKSLERLGVTLGKAAAGSKTAQKALGSVGITLNDINTKTRTEIFGKIADQMNKQGGAAKNAAAGNAILGESASKMTPLLDKGSKGISEFAAAAERLGIVMSDKQIEDGTAALLKLEDVQKILTAQFASVIAENANSIVSLAQALGNLTSAVINFLGSNPQAALGIIGALAGGRFGVPGAIAGGLAGVKLGGVVAQNAADANMDPRFRAQQIRRAQADLAKARAAGSAAGRNIPGVGTQFSKSVAEAQKELARQGELGKQALAAIKRGGASSGAAAIPQFLAPAPPRARRTRQGPRDRSDDVAFQFAQELRRADLDILRAHQNLAGTADERARLAIEMLALEKQMQDAEVDNRVRVAKRDFAEGKITESALHHVEAQAGIMKQKNAEAFKLQERAILQDRELERMERADELSQRNFENEIEGLRFADEMATTREEHRAIQRQIVDTLYDQKEAHLRSLKAQLEFAGKIQEAADVQAQINRLPIDRARDRARADRATASPLEDWSRQFGDINDELDQLQVQGIMGAVDALTQLTNGFDSFADAARSAIQSVLQELIRLQLMKLAVSLIGTASGTGGFSSSAFAATEASNFAALGVPGFARGGSMVLGGRPGVDTNVLSLNGLPIATTSYGERATFTNDNGPMSGATFGDMHFNFPGITNAREARQASLHAAHAVRRAVAQSMGK